MMLNNLIRKITTDVSRQLLSNSSDIALTTDSFKCLFHNSAPTCARGKWVWKHGAGVPVYHAPEYTIKPVKKVKVGGRGPDGRVWNHREGGGHAQNYRMVDFRRQRLAKDGKLTEKVIKIIYDPCRSADLALVMSGMDRRYIIASKNMKPGDLINTGTDIPDIPVKAVEGDAHPIGALPVGTMVHCIEKRPNNGGKVARAAGSSAQLIRKVGDKCTVKMPSGREILIQENCMATIGQVGNEDYGSIPMGSPNRKRWLGIRPRSGLWHKKDGRQGRKINPPKKLVDYTKEKKKTLFRYHFTV